MAVIFVNTDGTTAYASIPDSGTMETTALTVSLWFNCHTLSTTPFIISARVGGTGYSAWGIYLSPAGNIGFECRTSTNQDLTLASGVVNADQWYHLVVTFNSGTATAYLDGKSVGFASATGTSLSGTQTVSAIGRYSTGGQYFDGGTVGGITQVGIWSVVLTADEIAQLYAAVDPTTIEAASLQAFYLMNEGSGSTLTDTSGNGRTATLNGTYAWLSATSIETLGGGVQCVVSFKGNSGYQSSSNNYSGTAKWYGNSRFLAVSVAMLSVNDTVTAMTYGGAACTLVGAQTVAGGTGRIELWRITSSDSGAPAIGGNTLSVTISGTLANVVMWVPYIGVDQTTPTEGFASNSGVATGTTATVTVSTTVSNSWVYAALATSTASGVVAQQVGRNNVNGSLGTGADEDNGPFFSGGAQTMQFTSLGSLSAWTIGGYAIRPVPTGVAPPIARILQFNQSVSNAASL